MLYFRKKTKNFSNVQIYQNLTPYKKFRNNSGKKARKQKIASKSGKKD